MAYAAAIQASRDASMEAAARRFEEATTLDPSFAAAHLRAAPVELRYEPTRARAHFQKAVQLRTLLDARDQSLLDGIEPIVRDPPDYAEADRRLQAGLQRFPDDPELLYHTSWARFLDGRFAEAIEAIDRATRVAPDAASLSFMRANIELYGGTRDGALRALDRCLQQAPGATHCLQRRVLIEELDGRCVDAERDARRWLGADPESPVARRWLAQDLFALGKPRGAVDEMLRQAWAIAPAGDRAAMELEDRAVMDELSGNFAEGEKSLAKLDQLVSKSPELLAHVTSTWEQFQSYRETGDLTRAGTVASEFLRRKDAWIPLAANDDFAVEIDLTPPMLAMQRRSGVVTGAEYDRQMSAWLDGWKRRLPRPYRGYLWIYGIAATVETREQARAALAALPEYEPLPWFRPGLLAGAVVGRVRLLAGDPKGALPDLALAAHSCRAFDDPVRWVQSSAWLGAARETTGDVAGACADYKRVTDRWGPASKSVTAREVRARRAALRCK